MKKVLLIMSLIFMGLALRGYIFASNTMVCFCHNVNHNPHTICTSVQGQINGHQNHVNNGEDIEGPCAIITSIHEQPTRVQPSDDPTGTPEATVKPTPTVFHPSATPTPSGQVQGVSSQVPSSSEKPDPNTVGWK